MRATVLQSDLILIGLCLNTIEVYSESGKPTGKEQAAASDGTVRQISDFLLEHSQLYVASYVELKSTLYGLGILNIKRVQAYNFLSLEPASPLQAEAWSAALQLLTRITEFCRERHYPFVIPVFPMEVQLSAAVLQQYRDRLHVQLGPRHCRANHRNG